MTRFTRIEDLGYGIIVYKDAVPQEWRLIDRLEKSLSNDKGPLTWRGSRVGFFDTDLDHRNCQDFIYTKEQIVGEGDLATDLLEIHDQVYQSLTECMSDYNDRFGISIKWIGAFNMVKYGPGEKFNVHSDDGEPFRCTVSCVGYINDNYKGGELYFKYFDLAVKPEAGDLVLFPSSYIYAHSSIPVTEGVKYAVVVMTDRNEVAHKNDSPIYHSLEERAKYGFS